MDIFKVSEAQFFQQLQKITWAFFSNLQIWQLNWNEKKQQGSQLSYKINYICLAALFCFHFVLFFSSEIDIFKLPSHCSPYLHVKIKKGILCGGREMVETTREIVEKGFWCK